MTNLTQTAVKISPVVRADNALIIDATELARRWSLPESWIRDQTRSRATDPIPHIRFGRYVRFLCDDPSLEKWLERHKSGGKQ